MKHVRSCAGFALLAAASMAAVGCQNTPAEPVGTNASLTSAEVVAGAPPPEPLEPTGSGEALACNAPSSGDAPYCSAPVASASTTTGESPAPPRGSDETATEGFAAKRMTAVAKRAPSDHGGDTAALDEAIRQDVASSEHSAVASTEPVATDVTTTSATVAAPPPAPSYVHVTFVNRLSDTYRLVRVQVIVDGAVYYDESSAGSVQVPAGDRSIEVIADYQFHDSLFPSAGNYRMEVRSAQSIHAEAGGDFVATADPTGGVTTPIEKGVKIDWHSLAAR